MSLRANYDTLMESSMVLNAHQYPIQFQPLLKCAQVGICLHTYERANVLLA